MVGDGGFIVSGQDGIVTEWLSRLFRATVTTMGACMALRDRRSVSALVLVSGK